MKVTLNTRRDFSLENLRKVALQDGRPVIGRNALRAMKQARTSFMQMLDSDRSQFIYGTTSGPGQRASEPIPAKAQKQQAQEMRRVPAGGGFSTSFVPERVVRMILFARLANYIEGNAKTRPIEAQRITQLFDDPMPKLPLSGQVGAGEILPLFHVLHGIRDADVEEAEPMARINGSPVSAGMLADAALTSAARLSIAEKVFALSAHSYGAPLEYVDKALLEYWQARGEHRSITNLNRWLYRASKPLTEHQPPCSFRIMPRVLGAAHEAVLSAQECAEISLSSVTDNPVYLLPGPDNPQGLAISTGGYHNAQASPAIDTINARFADLCTLADRQTMRLHSDAHLPTNLAPPGAKHWGTALLSFVQVGYGEEARHAAQRTFLPPSEGGGIAGQNDVASATTLSYQKHSKSGICLDSALALLAASASQAYYATQRRAPPKLRAFLDEVRCYVKPVRSRSGRNLGRELGRLRAHFEHLVVETM